MVTQFYKEWNVEKLPVDDFFTRIVALLPKQIEKPADQQLYQDFVSTFGTHALNNCSFGGKIIVSLHIRKGYFEMKTSSFIAKQAEILVAQRIQSLIGKKTHFENIDSEFAAQCLIDVEFEGMHRNTHLVERPKFFLKVATNLQPKMIGSELCRNKTPRP